VEDTPGSSRFMDHLLFRSLKGQATDSEEEALLEWRRASPENEEQYRELERLLSLVSDGYGLGQEGPGPAPDGAELLARAGIDVPDFEARIERRAAGGRRASGLLRRAWLAGGAVAAGLVAFMLLHGPATEPVESLSFGADEFQTGLNDVATISLRDGTVIRLAPRSRLRVTGTLGAREVTLDGRAFFAVPTIDGDPFTVKSKGGDAVVLGTRFDAEARGDELQILVVEGRVALTTARERVEVNAGEMGRAVQGDLAPPIRVPDPYRELLWMGDFLVFQRTPIRQVAAEIERHFGIRVEVLGTELERQTVTASFAENGVEDVLGVVCRVLTARCSLEAEHATIDLTPSA
jgi:transmembrane sensor